MSVVAIIGCMGIPAQYGGFETLAENLVKNLSGKHQFVVYCSRNAYEKRPPSHLGARLKYIPLDANGAQSIPYDIWSMIHASRTADVMLVLGVSGCIFLPILKLFCRKTIIVHLDGIDWERPKWGWAARNFLRLSETIAAKFADELIADNTAIQEYIVNRYGKASHLIAYGGDHAVSELPVSETTNLSVVSLHKKTRRSVSPDIDPDTGPYAFAVCRIEPENNIQMILEAFNSHASLPLVFVGNWSTNAYGRSLKARYTNSPNIQLLDPIYDESRLFDLRSNALLYVHGHSAGGTNPSLVEAMYHGLPILAYDVVFNRATTHGKALYFQNGTELLECLDGLDQIDLDSISTDMSAISRTFYTWSAVSKEYSRLFDANSGGNISNRPDRRNVSDTKAALPKKRSSSSAYRQ